MSTAVLELDSVIEVEPELKKRADVVFNQLGMSASKAVNLLLNYVVSLKRMPEDLGRPSIPCIDDITEDELDDLFQQGIDEIEAGNFYTFDEVKKEMHDAYGIEL